MAEYDVSELGDVALRTGQTLGADKLLYTTCGTLNKQRTNVIVHPPQASTEGWK